MVTMPLRNSVYEIIRNSGSMTASELSKALTKAGITIPEDEFNKTLLNLEIYGLIKVTWLTKDERRIEIATREAEEDEVEKMARESLEKEYEAGFPGVAQDEEES